MTYNHVDDVPADLQRELMEDMLLAARKLREWRDYGAMHELRGSYLNADGEIVLICHHDDRVTLVDGDSSVDLTPLLDR